MNLCAALFTIPLAYIHGYYCHMLANFAVHLASEINASLKIGEKIHEFMCIVQGIVHIVIIPGIFFSKGAHSCLPPSA